MDKILICGTKTELREINQNPNYFIKKRDRNKEIIYCFLTNKLYSEALNSINKAHDRVYFTGKLRQIVDGEWNHMTINDPEEIKKRLKKHGVKKITRIKFTDNL